MIIFSTTFINKLFLACCLVLMSSYVSASKETLEEAIRTTIKAARYSALITIDETGQPRARTVDPFEPDENFIVWISTRPVTRKVAQIRSNPKVTLYYWDSNSASYVSLVGKAELINDEAIKKAKRRPQDSKEFYPDFPNDYLLIKFTPDYIEASVPNYRGNQNTWAPEKIELKPH